MGINEYRIRDYILELNSGLDDIVNLDGILNNLGRFGDKKKLEESAFYVTCVNPYRHNVYINSKGEVSIDVFKIMNGDKSEDLEEPAHYELGCIKDFNKK